jgi:hypothetical protein
MQRSKGNGINGNPPNAWTHFAPVAPLPGRKSIGSGRASEQVIRLLSFDDKKAHGC